MLPHIFIYSPTIHTRTRRDVQDLKCSIAKPRQRKEGNRMEIEGASVDRAEECMRDLGHWIVKAEVDVLSNQI